MRPCRTILAALLLAGCAAPALAEREVIPNADQMTPEAREAYRAKGLVGNAERGATLHQGCFGCHGVERYTAPVTHASAAFFDSMLRASGLSDLPPAPPKRFRGRITSMAELRQAVISRNDYLNPKLTAQEVEDVVAYLDKAYYRFAEK